MLNNKWIFNDDNGDFDDTGNNYDDDDYDDDDYDDDDHDGS